MSEKIWSDDAWADYLYWQTQDKKTLKRINLLIKDIERNGTLSGIGDPEALKDNLHGEFSRRINEKDRLVYHLEDSRSISFPAVATMMISNLISPSPGAYLMSFVSCYIHTNLNPCHRIL